MKKQINRMSLHRCVLRISAVVCFMMTLMLITSAAVPASSKKSYSTYDGVSYSRVYDYEYYTSQSYGKKYAGKPQKAIEHFVKYGMAKEQQAIADFDPKSYRYGCSSLRKKYRNDYKEYYLHYQEKGYKRRVYRKYATGVTQMRNAATKYGQVELKSIYDYNYYTARYPSVVKKVGDDDRAVLKYFVEHGMKKGHVAKDPKLYPKASRKSSTYTKKQQKIVSTDSFDGTGLIVCIDPGHQSSGDYSREPIGPGSSTTKPKVASGAYGSYSHRNEYEITLEIGLKLRTELLDRGYTVVMTRTTNNVRISNSQRAQIANNANADICVRLHANDIDEAPSLNGVFCYAPAHGNRWLSSKIVSRAQRLAVLLRDYQAKSTGQRTGSNLYQNDMTGNNWAKMPSVIIEMGYMSNPTEDIRLSNSAFQLKIATGLANGIDKYFLELNQ